MSPRTCSIRGCDAPHRAHGWCLRHYMRWYDHGSPTAPLQRVVSPAQIREMRDMAKAGLTRAEIAERTGRSYQTVSRHVGRLTVPAAGPQPDLDRYRRMLRAVAVAPYGERHDIARRFGLASRKSLDVTLIRARRLLARAEQEQHHG